MSSRQYTVTVKLKDDGLLKKLEGVGGGGGKASGGTSGVFGGGGDIFRRLETLGAAQLLKLTGIGIGVGSLVALTVKSSGLLQGTFRLWENGMQLVFKPIGDFIAMSFRPWVHLMLQLAIPFYKIAHKWIQDFTQGGKAYELDPGKAPPERLDAQFLHFEKMLAGKYQQAGNDIQKAWDGFTKTLSTNLKDVPGGIVKTFSTLGGDLTAAFKDIPNGIITKFTNLGSDLTNSFIHVPKVFVDTFFTTATDLWNELVDIPHTIADVFIGLAGDISTALAGIPGKIYDAIMSFVNSLIPGGGGGGGMTPDTSSRFPNGNTRTRTTMAGIADTARV